MATTRRHIVAAVVLGTATATIAEMRPPTVDDATAFIGAAVARHHAVPALREDERAWAIAVEFSGCSVERRTSRDVRVLGRWEVVADTTRWGLADIDTPAIGVTDAPGGGSTFLVALPCAGDRRCVDRGRSGRDRITFLELTSRFMAERVAAAFRYAADRCTQPQP